MRRISLAALAALSLAGCVTSPYGNHLRHVSVDQQKLADDAVKQLATLWPPAKTQFELKQTTPDVFGNALVKNLRESGYAVMEFSPNTTEDNTLLPLRYVLSQIKGENGNLYHLTLWVGTESITRPYIEQNGMVMPGGYWTHKE
ncbi:conjugal transfer protein TrbH [Methylotuvimicrobium sp. KM1]|uniref:conjugal transfer protein TrbH n=1 Tax=Methylotuvimicrobium sp. KM1 TaxID=3377707 RepID=UPI00384F0D00